MIVCRMRLGPRPPLSVADAALNPFDAFGAPRLRADRGASGRDVIGRPGAGDQAAVSG